MICLAPVRGMGHHAGMCRVIALTQFVFVTLGTMALMILMKTPAHHSGVSQTLRVFLSQYGLWMLLIPVVWVTMAEVVQRGSPGERALQVLQASGILIAAAMLVVYSWLVLSF